MKKNQISIMTTLLAVFSATSTGYGGVLLREEFDGYTAGSVVGQAGLAMGMTGTWEQPQSQGTFNLGPGLSGDNALVIASTGDHNLYMDHNVTGWGTGQLWISYLYSETSYGGHFYVSGGPNFSGAVGHAWNSFWGINNSSNNVAYTANEVNRVVALVDWDAGTTTMWVDPDPATAPITDPADAGFAPTAYKDSEAQSTTPRIRIGSYSSGIIDDIIIGTDYADVAIAVPDDAPAAPSVINPLDAATNVLLDSPLEWTPNGASTYDVFLWKDGETVPVDATITVTAGSYTPGNLDAGTLYNWRVDSTNENGSTVGAVWTFTTGDGVDAILPPNGVSNVPVELPLEWTSSGATSYDVYLWKDGETKPATPTATVTEESYPQPGLDPSSTYNWEVVSNYASGSPTTSQQWSFTTGTGVAGTLLLREEFEGYSAGSIIGQFATGVGLDSAQAWANVDASGAFEIGPGLSGSQGLVVTADMGVDAQVPHTVEGWGSGVFYMSYLYNELAFGGHSYVSGGGSFDGAFGHAWDSFFGINNTVNPGLVEYTQDQTYRLVARVDFDSGVTTMWADPTYEFDPPAAVKSEVQSSNQMLILRYYGTDATIDDIRIGTDFASVTQVLEAAPAGPSLTVQRSGGDLTFTWDSESGNLYDLVSSVNLDTAPSTWPVYNGNMEIAADGDGFNDLTLPVPVDAKRFFAVKGYLPPPASLFDSDFEADNGGLMAVDYSGGTGSLWAWGAPDSDNGAGSSVSGGNDSSANAWGLNLGDSGASNGGFYNTSTDAGLQLAIDLSAASAATLNFVQALDLDGGDTAVINFLDVDDSNNVAASVTVTDGDPNMSPWEDRSIPVPAAALGKNLLIEWRLTSGGIASDFIGWYIDDISVTTP